MNLLGKWNTNRLKLREISKLSRGFQFELLIKAIVFSNPYEEILLIDVSGHIQNVIPFVYDAQINYYKALDSAMCAWLVASY